MNHEIHVNLSDHAEIMENSGLVKYIRLNGESGEPIEPMYKFYPDADFCIYKDFPFDQLVFNFQSCTICVGIEVNEGSVEHLEIVNPFYTCTYLWINRYYYLVGDFTKTTLIRLI